MCNPDGNVDRNTCSDCDIYLDSSSNSNGDLDRNTELRNDSELHGTSGSDNR